MLDREIVTSLHAGDEQGMSLLYARYARPLKVYAFRLIADEQEAEDLVHEAFLRFLVLARGGLFDPARGTVQSLVYRIVRNLCLDRLRSARRTAPLSGAEAAAEPAASDAARRVRQATRALEQLPAQYRQALLLRVREGLSYAAIAAALGASLAQVKTWIFRARCQVRRTIASPWSEFEGDP